MTSDVSKQYAESLGATDRPYELPEKLAYAIGGGTGKDLIMAMLTTYLLYFYTDVLGITAAAAGMVLFTARIWDGINDPLVGVMVDKTRSRWGTFRPYILFVPIPLAIFCVLTFTVPDLTGFEKTIWALVTYIITGMLYTAYDVPFWALIPRLTNDGAARNQTISITRISALLSFMIISIVALPAVAILGGDNTALGFQRFMIIIGVISIVCAWLAFFTTRERVVPSTQKPELKDYSNAIRGNHTLVALLTINTIPLFGLSMVSAMAVYGMTYWIGKPELIPLYMGLTLFGMIAGIAITPSLAIRFGNRACVIWSLYLAPIPLTGAFLMGDVSHFAFMGLFFLVGACFGVQEVVIPAMIAKCADDSSRRTGVRTDGVIFSLLTFSTKVGLAFGAGLAGVALGWAGYVANAIEQSELVTLTISLLWTILPGTLCFIGAGLMTLFVKEW